MILGKIGTVLGTSKHVWYNMEEENDFCLCTARSNVAGGLKTLATFRDNNLCVNIIDFLVDVINVDVSLCSLEGRVIGQAE